MKIPGNHQEIYMHYFVGCPDCSSADDIFMIVSGTSRQQQRSAMEHVAKNNTHTDLLFFIMYTRTEVPEDDVLEAARRSISQAFLLQDTEKILDRGSAE